MSRRLGVRLSGVWLSLAVVLSGGATVQEGVAADKPTASRWALLIGVDDYVWARKLEYCGADMQALGEQLVACGFPKDHVYLLHDKADNKSRPTKAIIEAQLKVILGLVERHDLVVVGFSGHGVNVQGKSYLCPADAKLDDAKTLVSVDSVYELLQKSPASLKLLVFDACRNDPRPGGERALEPTEGTRQFAKSLEQPPQGILLLTSCAPGEIAREEKEFGHGVFMHFLLEGLKGQADANQNGRVSLMELYLYANDKTKTYVARKFVDSQRPALRGEVHDDFDLVRLEGDLSSPERRRQVTAAFTVRETDEHGAAFPGATLELLYRPKPDAEAIVLGRATSDAQGAASMTLWLTPAQQREGEFLAVLTSSRGSKTDPLPGFPKSLRWNLYVPGGSNVITNSIGMKMVLIPAGEFMMGSSESAEELGKAFAAYDAKPWYFKADYPYHRVRITRPFYLGAYEVTVGQFRKFVEDSGYKTDAEKDGKGAYGYKDGKLDGQKPEYSWRNTGFEQTDEHPVVNLSWNDAVAFCEWLSRKEGKTYRLPTEAEWEYACRAGTTTRYWSGDDPETLMYVGNVADATWSAKFPYMTKPAILNSDGYVFTAPVGRFRANAFGLYDMHGNVVEWCQDWYDEDYYAKSPAEDPVGPDSGEFRVLRGGSWGVGPGGTLSARRFTSTPDSRFFSPGFRAARTP